MCNIYIGSSFLYSSTCSFLSLFCTYILTFICLFFFLYFSCVSGRVFIFFFFIFIIVCLALSHMIANYFFSQKKKHFVVLLFSSRATLSICVTFSICSNQPEKNKHIYVVLDRYIYMCDGCIFGIKPTHCECWFQL